MKTIAAILLCLSLSEGVGFADDFKSALAKAFSQLPDGADTAAMGNASTATADFSSRNPAIIAVETEGTTNAGAMATYGNIRFDSGLNLNFYSASATARLPKGSLQVILSNGRSNTGTMDPFDTAQLSSSPGIEVQYGLKLAEKLLADDALYLGGSYAYNQSKLTLHNTTLDENAALLDTAVASEGSSHTTGLGAVYRVKKTFTIGGVWLHSWERSEDTTSISGAVFDRTTSRTQNEQLRLGAALQVTPMTLVAADYRHLYLDGGTGDDQYYAGIEQGIIKDLLYLYAGWADGGIAGGLGVYLKHGGLNLAYQHRPFRSLEPFFGRATMLTASLYWTL